MRCLNIFQVMSAANLDQHGAPSPNQPEILEKERSLNHLLDQFEEKVLQEEKQLNLNNSLQDLSMFAESNDKTKLPLQSPTSSKEDAIIPPPTDYKERGFTTVRSFIQYKHNQKSVTKKLKCNIEKLKKDMVERALNCSGLGSVMDKAEYDMDFRFFRFFKFFLYHLIYFIFGPPLTMAIVSIFDSYGLALNMGFSIKSTVKITSIFQFMFFLFDAFIAIMWILRTVRPESGYIEGIYQEQLWFFFVHTIMRCFIQIQDSKNNKNI